jgi:hypothetical protein
VARWVAVFRSSAITCVVLAAITPAPTYAQDQEPQYKPGPWHYRSIPCADSTVIRVAPRLQLVGQTVFTADDYEQSGVQVEFARRLGVDPAFPSGHASVTHYQGTVGNDVMTGERPGDRVQAGFLGYPAPTTTCDPDKDSRGRTYRVYDYRQRASYVGWNSEHICGGA